MPIYERRCLGVDCGKKFCILLKVEDREEPRECPSCGHPWTLPVMSATPTTFRFADAKAIKTVVKRQGGFGKLTGRDAKYYADKHNMTPKRNPRPEE